MRAILTIALCGVALAACASPNSDLQDTAIGAAMARYEYDLACRRAGLNPPTPEYSACFEQHLNGTSQPAGR